MWNRLLVEKSTWLLAFVLVGTGMVMALPQLGTELYLATIWNNFVSNPLYILIAGISAFGFGYARSFRKQVLNAEQMVGVIWTAMISTFVLIFFRLGIFIAGLVFYSMIVPGTNGSAFYTYMIFIIIIMCSVAGHIMGSAFIEPHYEEFLNENDIQPEITAEIHEF
ncbi:MAG: hypothetical protein ACFFD4_28125 [Candidatus Odinarchaeota archaeon]